MQRKEFAFLNGLGQINIASLAILLGFLFIYLFEFITFSTFLAKILKNYDKTSFESLTQ